MNLGEAVHRRIAEMDSVLPDSIGAMLQFRMRDFDPETNDITLTCRTMPWMRNFAGTLHGVLCATVLDQAMGFVSHCLKPGEGTAPAVQLSVNYHRPLQPGEAVIVKVHVVSVTRSLANLTAEAFQASAPEKTCLSGSGIYFFKGKS